MVRCPGERTFSSWSDSVFGGGSMLDRLRRNAFRSFPRKREPSFCSKAWAPASAGANGAWPEMIQARQFAL